MLLTFLKYLYVFSIFAPLLGTVSLSMYYGQKHLKKLYTFLLGCTLLPLLLTPIYASFFLVQYPFLENYPNILTNCEVILAKWIVTDFIYIKWGFLFDALTLTMVFIVTFISLCVQIYSLDYMSHDKHKQRFMSYLALFTFFMLILVTANNFLQMFVGWEGVGVCSFLLINFWTTRIQANKAAIKAMLLNRIGDFSLILGVFAIFFQFNSLDYNLVFSLVPYTLNQTITFLSFQWNLITVISLCLFFGAVGKSAQIGLHAWLPDAMEGPTPVSALIHSATMVTAGVFLLIRVSPLIEYSSTALIIITCVGALTTFFAATIGVFQNDIKRIIAYSTCSQLGYMVFSCGLSNYNISLFHLFNHAFFKALLFLCSGAIIHALYDEQDIRKMGGLRNVLPVTYTVMLIASLALIGFPFLSGFYSKDLILEAAYSTYTSHGFFAYFLGCFAAFCTAFYSYRLLYLVFLTNFNGFRPSILQVHEVSKHIPVAFLALVIPSMFSGFFFKDLFIGDNGLTFWKTAIYTAPEHLIGLESEFIPFEVKIFPLVLTMGGIFFGIILYFILIKYNLQFKLSTVGLFFYNFFNRKWYFDKLNNLYMSNPIIDISYKYTYQLGDRGIIEFFGPFGINFLINHFSNLINKTQTNSFYLYIYLLIGTIAGILNLIFFFSIPLHFFNFYFFGFALFFFSLYFFLINEKS